MTAESEGISSTRRHTVANDYDIFLAHHSKDKAWTRALAARLAAVDYLGRPLRPWLDENYLDPGELGKEAELTSALDRSRLMAIVLTPDTAASRWVGFELNHFLTTRDAAAVVPILKAASELPAAVSGLTPLDLTAEDHIDEGVAALVNRICPNSTVGVDDVVREVWDAWNCALFADPGGLDSDPLPERDALAETLLRYDIGDPAGEGLAITAILTAARLLAALTQGGDRAVYNLKMLLAECLALGVVRDPRYGPLLRQLVDVQDVDASDPTVSFVSVRTAGMLAEIDPLLLDAGLLLRITTRLDAARWLTPQAKVLAMLVGRVLGRLRGTDRGDIVIGALADAGPASRCAAITAICVSERGGPSMHYLPALTAVRESHRDTKLWDGGQPPSRRLLGLLSDMDMGGGDVVARHLESSKYDLERFFGLTDLPYGYFWATLRRLPPPTIAEEMPFAGTVALATAANMEEVAERVGPSHVVCLTEPRVVDALFATCAGLLLPDQESDSLQCQRLRGRHTPFAVLPAEVMTTLRAGDQVVVASEGIRVLGSETES